MSDATLIAPVSGFVSKRNIEQGTMASSGTTVFTIVELDPVEIQVGVPETDVRLVHRGLELSKARLILACESIEQSQKGSRVDAGGVRQLVGPQRSCPIEMHAGFGRLPGLVGELTEGSLHSRNKSGALLRLNVVQRRVELRPGKTELAQPDVHHAESNPRVQTRRLVLGRSLERFPRRPASHRGP